ncbi:hypothetical protein [Segniliparus rugosus]|uniref:GNAT family N-acetyltransferase n=1 Tax=Segniliparus rugosus (strain ATCC BAA-974 / DSM 45345 / CCUG 50838 / CIP 108380 / JCM 13579 / CDC 945) TaxID=679197 RepID=E5XV87_SEGRC|nr:hypothetical protein [Segniliparus rugosus]EFV11700.1 hypothetical protein HMPREF9336_03409 [Segniliparus rugosus ATCC BAA-974]
MSSEPYEQQIRVVPLTLERSALLPKHARQCLFWEFDSKTGKQIEGFDAGFEKEAWLSSVLLQWGTCGQLAVVGEDEEERGVGQICYAPPSMVSRAAEFPTAPVSHDAVLVTYAGVDEGHDFAAIGQRLLLASIADLARRGVRAIEAFGREEAAEADERTMRCVNPTDFFLGGGFTVAAAHKHYPRLRLEIGGSGLLWRASVEAALAELVEEARVRPVLVGATS